MLSPGAAGTTSTLFQVEARSEFLRRHAAVCLFTHHLDLFPVDPAVETNSEPPSSPDVRWPEKPVGLVWFAVAAKDGSVETRKVTLPGSRDDVRRRAVIGGLNLVWRHLERVREAAAS